MSSSTSPLKKEKSSIPDPEVIANTNLNLSRLFSAPSSSSLNQKPNDDFSFNFPSTTEHNYNNNTNGSTSNLNNDNNNVGPSNEGTATYSNKQKSANFSKHAKNSQNINANYIGGGFPHLNLSRKSLNHQPSKLDLIDDTTLTSLPLPPPLKQRGRNSTQASLTSCILPGERSKVNSPVLNPCSRSSSTSETESTFLNYKLNSDGNDYHGAEDEDDDDDDDDDEDDDDDDEEDQDPIVLIEDYMTKRRHPENSGKAHRSSNTGVSDPGNFSGSASIHSTNNSSFVDKVDVDSTSDTSMTDLSASELDRLVNKKKSLATFKQRMLKNSLANSEDVASISDISTITSSHNFDDTIVSLSNAVNTESLTNSLLNSLSSKNNSVTSLNKQKNKRSISNETDCQRKRKENLEEIFGKIPGTDLLKYCDLCDKPLYEISSIINNNKRFKKMNRDKVNNIYTEFICGECVETYEEFFNELYQNELNESAHQHTEYVQREQNSKNIKLLEIFQSIGQKYEEAPPPASQVSQLASRRSFFGKLPTYKRLANKTSFSENLMGRLTYLNSIPEGSSYQSVQASKFGFTLFGRAAESEPLKKNIDIEWIKNLQSKLRWNWTASSSLEE